MNDKLDEDKVRQIASEVATQTYNTLGTRFGVARVPVHTHNGQDTNQIPFSNIVNTSEWRILRRVVLTADQIKALNGSPVTLIPALPSTNSARTSTNNMIIVEGITAFLDYGGTAFTGANNLEFRYTNGAGTKVTADISSTFLNGVADSFQHVAGVTTAFAPVPNAPIVVSVPVANPGTGNSTLVFVLAYRTVSY